MHQNRRQQALARWSAFVCHRPVAVLVVTVLLAAVCAIYSWTSLGFQSDRNDLLSKKLPWNRRYLEYRQRFEAQDRVVVAVMVPPGDDGRGRAEAYIRDLAGRLEANGNHIRRVWWGYDPGEGSPSLIRLLPWEEFRQRLSEIAQSQPLLVAPTVTDFLTSLMAAMTRQGDDPLPPAQAVERIDQVEGVIAGIGSVLAGETDRLALQPDARSWEFLETDDGAMLLVDIELRASESDVDPHEHAVAAVREHMDAARRAHPGLESGLTGIPIMEVDETRISRDDAILSTSIAAVLILVMMVVAYHSLAMPVLSQAALMLGVAWSYGYLTLAIGHLQVISLVFTVILLGLGVDFGIHIISQLERVRHNYPDGLGGFRDALREALVSAGPGIITGAVTTAVAFVTTMYTDFTGMAELGHIAGVGVVLCLIAALTALPAMLRLLRPGSGHIKRPDQRVVDMHAQEWLMPFARRPWWTLAVTAALLAAAAPGLVRVRFDNNLLNLLPTGLESVEWQDRIVKHSSQAIWFAVSTTDSLDEARRLSGAFRAKGDLVESLGGTGLLFPPDEAEKIEAIKETHALLAPALSGEVPATMEPQALAGLHERLSSLDLLLTAALNRPDVRGEPDVHAALGRLLARVRQTLDTINDPSFASQSPQRTAALHRAFIELRDGTRSSVDQALTTRPLTPDDLTPILRRESLSAGEPLGYQVKVYPKEDVWEEGNLDRFVNEMRAIDPAVTGSPVQIYDSGNLMKRSYRQAGLLALCAMLLLVFIDFRSVGDTVLAMLPVGLGFVLLLGVMWAVGESINPANVMILPLMLGIGVDNGVHILHRYRQAPDARPLGLAQGTGKGVILTSLTTIIGFSAMLFAHHRGVRSLGFTLAVGMALTLAVSLFVMPAILELRDRSAKRNRV